MRNDLQRHPAEWLLLARFASCPSFTRVAKNTVPSTNSAPITKSQFKLGLTCLHKLRHARNKLPQTSQTDAMLNLLSEGGAAVEAVIRATEPGRMIGGFGHEALKKSHEAMAGAFAQATRGTSTSLYEVTIRHGDFLARIDLLRIKPDGIELIEIKAKTAEAVGSVVADDTFLKRDGLIRPDWLEYIQDLTFQVELLKRWLAEQGPKLGAPASSTTSPKILVVNKLGTATPGTVLNRSNFESKYEPGRRGIRASVNYIGTEADRQLLVEVPMDHIVAIVHANAGSKVGDFAHRSIPECMTAMAAIVNADRWPAVKLSWNSGCKSCEFRVKPGLDSGFDRCWGPPADRPTYHVLELTLLKAKQLDPAITAAGPNASVSDVPESALTATQQRQYRSVLADAPTVDRGFAADPLATLARGSQGPIYFLDFETSAYPIPSRVGGRPYELIPFQFEAHSMPHAAASLRERVRLPGFLNVVDADPRRAFIDGLMQQVGDHGLIFHWHSYERTVLNSIKQGLLAAPEAGDDARVAFIDSLAGADGKRGGRLIDLLVIAKASFYHPAQHGSYSIKKVVPIAWGIESIREQFIPGHGAMGDPDSYTGDVDPYDGLADPPESILRAVGGKERVREVIAADEGDESGDAIRNGGMAMLAYHYVRMFNDQPNEAILQQFRQYCRLDSAAMVMAYGLMRDHVKGWRGE